MELNFLDWLIVAIPVLIVAALSIYAQRYVKNASDFLAGGRAAGRYLICNAEGAAALGAITIVALFEQIYNGGPAVGFWAAIATPVGLMVTLTGFVIYRYRETRAMTLAQFFEMRYSKRFRVFMGLLAFVSGVINFGIFPAVGARFITNFCGFPESLTIFGTQAPTFALVMAFMVSMNLLFATLGGQLTAMVSDCIEGILSTIFFLVIVMVLLWLVGLDDIRETLVARPAGKSFVDPYDTFSLQDFNISFILIGIFFSVYHTMAWQGNQGFNASALNPHEARMGRILGQWRTYVRMAMIVIIGLCAYVFMHHPDYAAQSANVQSDISGISGGETIQKQMTVPVALGHMLPMGVKGMFLAIVVFSMMATDTSYMHSWGSIFIQDVVLPFRKTHLSPKAHIRLLRWSIFGVALFAFCFSLLFKQTEYIAMYFIITGAIYLGGAGSVIIGGLYWSRGTASAAWSAMFVGSGLSVAAIVLRQMHPEFPLNGQILALVATLAAIGVYVTVSLVTSRRPHDMDKLLHRGPYALAEDGASLPEVIKPPRTWQSLIGIDERFTRSDRMQSISLFVWIMALFGAFVCIAIWNMLFRWPTDWWWNYLLVTAIILPLLIGVITTIWFGWGGIRDLGRLFSRLGKKRGDSDDDGEMVKNDLNP